MKATTITAAALVSAVLVLPGCRREAEPVPTAGGENVSQAVDDAWITTKVESQYFVNPEVKGRQIDVSTNNGVVTLTGVVDSDLARQQAVTIARRTEGVRDVQDRMAVKLPDQVATSGSSPAGTASGGADRGPASPPGEARDGAAGAAATETASDAGEAVSAAWTTTKIQAKYFADPDIKGRNIDVTTRDHVVTLAGHVENEVQRDKAVRLARETEGVNEVRNQLRIGTETAAAASDTERPSGSDATAPSAATPDEASSDSGLVARVQSKFYQNEDLRGSTIDVNAADGVVTLSGKVSSEARRRDAVAVARNTDGVKDVRDNLTVDPTVPPLPGGPAASAERAATNAANAAGDAWVTTKIQARFYLDPDIKGRSIDVSTSNGVVTLTGDVASGAVRDQALSIARETEGVSRVVDKLKVAGGI